MKKPLAGSDDDSERPRTPKGHAVAALRAFCKGRIAAFKVPRLIRIVEAFPLTTSGKVMKYVLRAEAEERLRRQCESAQAAPQA